MNGPGILVVPDGNRRWKDKHRCSFAAAYEEMARKIALIIDTLAAQGIDRVYVAVNSVENLGRDPAEVEAAFPQFWKVPGFARTSMRVVLRGNLELMPEQFRPGFRKLVTDTQHNRGFTLYYMVNWSMWDEVIRIINEAQATNVEVTPQLLMQMADINEAIDLVIRTGGRSCLSNFVPIMSPYAELAFLDTLWPDITADELLGALTKLKGARRKFGH